MDLGLNCIKAVDELERWHYSNNAPKSQSLSSILRYFQYVVYVPMCMYVHVCRQVCIGADVHACMCACTWGPELMSGIFLILPPFSLRQDISLEPRADRLVSLDSLLCGLPVSTFWVWNYRQVATSTHYLHGFWGLELQFPACKTSTLTTE